MSGYLCVAWEWNVMPPEDGRMLWEDKGGVPEGYERGGGRYNGIMQYCDYAWWGFEGSSEADQAQVRYCWAEDGGAAWPPSDDDLLFIKQFGAIDGKTYDRERLDTIETVVGDTEMIGFHRSDPNAYCIGLSHDWDRAFYAGSWLHKKWIDVYACGEDERWMSEEIFHNLLKGLTIKGEFESFVD